MDNCHLKTLFHFTSNSYRLNSVYRRKGSKPGSRQTKTNRTREEENKKIAEQKNTGTSQYQQMHLYQEEQRKKERSR
jgi:hypothetical protein